LKSGGFLRGWTQAWQFLQSCRPRRYAESSLEPWNLGRGFKTGIRGFRLQAEVPRASHLRLKPEATTRTRRAPRQFTRIVSLSPGEMWAPRMRFNERIFSTVVSKSLAIETSVSPFLTR
jgi:hypothetical protein